MQVSDCGACRVLSVFRAAVHDYGGWYFDNVHVHVEITDGYSAVPNLWTTEIIWAISFFLSNLHHLSARLLFLFINGWYTGMKIIGYYVAEGWKTLSQFSTSCFLGFTEGAANLGKWKSRPSEHRKHGEFVTMGLNSSSAFTCLFHPLLCLPLSVFWMP